MKVFLFPVFQVDLPAHLEHGNKNCSWELGLKIKSFSLSGVSSLGTRVRYASFYSVSHIFSKMKLCFLLLGIFAVGLVKADSLGAFRKRFSANPIPVTDTKRSNYFFRKNQFNSLLNSLR